MSDTPRSTFDPVVVRARLDGTDPLVCLVFLCRLQGGDVSLHQDVLGPQAHQAVCRRSVFLQVMPRRRTDFYGLCSKTVHMMCTVTASWKDKSVEEIRGGKNTQSCSELCPLIVKAPGNIL